MTTKHLDFPQLPKLFDGEQQANLEAWYYTFRQRLESYLNEASTSTATSAEPTQTETMTEERILAQLSPASGQLVTLYEAPPNKNVTGGRIVITNRGSTPTSYRIAAATSGAAEGDHQYLAYDVPVDKVDDFAVNIPLRARESIRVYSANGKLSFNLTGTLLDA